MCHVPTTAGASVARPLHQARLPMLSTLVTISLLSLGQPGPAADQTIVIPGRPPIDQALFNPDGRRIYFATHGGVEGHDIDTGKRLFAVPGGREIVCSPKGDLL